MPKTEHSKHNQALPHELLKHWQKLPLKTDYQRESPADYEQKWQKWIKKFIPTLVQFDASMHSLLFQEMAQLPYLRLYNFLEALENGATNTDFGATTAERVHDFLNDFAAFLNNIPVEEQTPNTLQFYARLKSSSLPHEVRIKFEPTQSAALTRAELATDQPELSELELQLSSVLNQPLSKENVKTLAQLLHDCRKLSQLPFPELKNLTELILASYGDSRKVRKSLKHLHQAQPEWAKTQTKQLQKKTKRK